MTYRQICAQVARELGVVASFMPKPTVGAMANGCHHNLSLWRDEENVFVDPDEPALHLTETARHALGGILEHARGMLAVLAPTVNSYARYWDLGQFAPSIVNWGYDNRTCAVRVSARGRLEFKLPDASVNPYLSHTLRARGDGRRAGAPARSGAAAVRRLVRRRTSSPPTARRGASRRCRAPSATRWSRWERTPSSRDALPPELYDAFVEYKTDEWERFCATVTEWHREMYLRAIP